MELTMNRFAAVRPAFTRLLSRDNFKAAAVLTVICAVLFAPVLIGAGGGSSGASGATDFDDILNRVVGWAEGSLGKALAIVFILAGVAMGIARGSLMAFAGGLGAGMGIYLTPTIIGNIFSAAV